MKKIVIILSVSLFLLNGQTFAQQKYGHINSVEIVQAMPEFKQLTAAVEQKEKDARTRVQTMYDNYQKKLKEANQYASSMMQAVKEEKMRELDSMQHDIQTFEQTASADIQQYRDKKLKPVNDKYLKIVGTVAKENGYTYIFDISSGTVAYHPETTGDISEEVKKKLGIN